MITVIILINFIGVRNERVVWIQCRVYPPDSRKSTSNQTLLSSTPRPTSLLISAIRAVDPNATPASTRELLGRDDDKKSLGTSSLQPIYSAGNQQRFAFQTLHMLIAGNEKCLCDLKKVI